ncbi:4855_t:CDS:2 [Paraglomus occultum]|uniref:4855_t:CDS:1 n=1 Tax=Paraglomus occultum TaxID=144539 RepID=A0A9N9AX31_9GLOM|nr:4855_t:CDS:2 [Paraglomus occultum]
MAESSYKQLVYSTLKTLNEPNNTGGDFFNHADDEIYIPESFSSFFGDFIGEDDIKDAIEQLHEEKNEGKVEPKVEVIAKKEEGWFTDVKKIIKLTLSTVEDTVHLGRRVRKKCWKMIKLTVG